MPTILSEKYKLWAIQDYSEIRRWALFFKKTSYYPTRKSAGSNEFTTLLSGDWIWSNNNNNIEEEQTTPVASRGGGGRKKTVACQPPTKQSHAVEVVTETQNKTKKSFNLKKLSIKCIY